MEMENTGSEAPTTSYSSSKTELAAEVELVYGLEGSRFGA